MIISREYDENTLTVHNIDGPPDVPEGTKTFKIGSTTYYIGETSVYAQVLDLWGGFSEASGVLFSFAPFAPADPDPEAEE